MATPTKQQRVDELIEGAKASLGRSSHFEAERMAMKALLLAHQVEDYLRMAETVQPLLEARRQRREVALQCEHVTIVEDAITENYKFGSGCYLVEPPQVGADARRLRMAALQSEIPVAVVCREPLTQLGLWPIVAIGPGATVRTKIDPPDDPAKPDMAWFIGAMQALGDAAIAGVDPEIEITRQIRLILERLDTVPDHDALHQLLEEVCRETAVLQVEPEAAKPAKKATVKSKAKA